MSRLDDLLNGLAEEPSDGSLDRLEADVWHRIEAVQARRAERRLATAIQATAVGLALIIGAVAGGREAAAILRTTHEVSIFSSRPDLAPSTLLEGLL